MTEENLASRVRAFQTYVSDQNVRRTASWPRAQQMVQQIADIVAKRVSEVPPLNLQLAAAMLNTSVVARSTSLRSYHGSLVPVTGGFMATIFSSENVDTNLGQSNLEVRDDSDVTLQLSRRAR